jgi:hypothetical protein
MRHFLTYTLKGCLLAALFFSACSPDKRSNERFKRISEGLQEHQLKRVTESQIMTMAYQQGAMIAQESQQALVSTLQKALQEGDIQKAIPFCNVNALPITDSLAREYNATIKRTALKIRNPKNEPDELEKQLLEAYQYTVEQGQSVKDNVQDLENGYMLYTKPIVLGNQLCLTCHGEVGKTVSEKNFQLIKKLYPKDQAIGFKPGDLRGMWSILLSKKEVINAIPAEDEN